MPFTNPDEERRKREELERQAREARELAKQDAPREIKAEYDRVDQVIRDKLLEYTSGTGISEAWEDGQDVVDGLRLPVWKAGECRRYASDDDPYVPAELRDGPGYDLPGCYVQVRLEWLNTSAFQLSLMFRDWCSVQYKRESQATRNQLQRELQEETKLCVVMRKER